MDISAMTKEERKKAVIKFKKDVKMQNLLDVIRDSITSFKETLVAKLTIDDLKNITIDFSFKNDDETHIMKQFVSDGYDWVEKEYTKPVQCYTNPDPFGANMLGI